MLIISVIINLLFLQLTQCWSFYHHKKYHFHRDHYKASSENVSSEKSSNSESPEHASRDESTSSEEKYSKLCPHEDESLVSESDIKYTIEDIAIKLQLEDDFRSSLLPEAVEVQKRYLKELEEILQHMVDRPVHLLHILEDIADTRHKLEPVVDDMTNKIQDSDILIRKYNGFSEQADTLLKKLDKSKQICHINCDYPFIDERFGHDITSLPHSKHLQNKNMSCSTLKDLRDYVTAELSEFKENLNQQLHWEVEGKRETYEKKFEDLKVDIKNAAVKQFGTTMYDILSLQDDYNHLDKELQNIEISSKMNELEEKTAQIKLILIGLKRGVEKYRQFCMNCDTNQRTRRSLQDATELRYDYSDSTHEDSDEDENQKETSNDNIIDILIKAKKTEILEKLNGHFEEIFHELDSKFDDPEVIEAYLSKLEPIQQDIDDHVKEEERELEKLRAKVARSDIVVLLDLLDESNHLVEELYSAQSFLNRYT